ncbi:hypothetical protein ZWY2020_000213 [Hordeum vulgare]|nr:hypothetical protein ZWY2020_000213 [Hordeum vulgare]
MEPRHPPTSSKFLAAVDLGTPHVAPLVGGRRGHDRELLRRQLAASQHINLPVFCSHHSIPAAQFIGLRHLRNKDMASAYDELEKRLQDSNAAPTRIPLEYLKAITSDFSAESVLGAGGYGVVYKGCNWR